mmetsp:Transcript_5849/g.12219  ORF Transcript_5849/g.12219 Transcript_5849/m.12219 type:complete len:371 (-) Transcript_5849:56-1168(-)
MSKRRDSRRSRREPTAAPPWKDGAEASPPRWRGGRLALAALWMWLWLRLLLEVRPRPGLAALWGGGGTFAVPFGSFMMLLVDCVIVIYLYCSREEKWGAGHGAGVEAWLAGAVIIWPTLSVIVDNSIENAEEQSPSSSSSSSSALFSSTLDDFLGNIFGSGDDNSYKSSNNNNDINNNGNIEGKYNSEGNNNDATIPKEEDDAMDDDFSLSSFQKELDKRQGQNSGTTTTEGGEMNQQQKQAAAATEDTRGVAEDDDKFTGYDLRDVIFSKYGECFDVEFQRVDSYGFRTVYLNILPFRLGGRKFRHETEYDYLCHLQAVVEILVKYDQLDYVMAQLFETNKKPRAGTSPLVAVPLRLNLTPQQVDKILG